MSLKSYLVVNEDGNVLEVCDELKDAEQICAVMNDRVRSGSCLSEHHVAVVNRTGYKADDTRPTVRKITVKVTKKRVRVIDTDGTERVDQNATPGYAMKLIDGYESGLCYFAGKKPIIEKQGRSLLVSIFTDKTDRESIFEEVLKVLDDAENDKT